METLAPWQALTVESNDVWEDVPLMELPPTATFSVVALVHGACRMESRGDRGWRSAIYAAGDVGITAPGRPVALRWQLLSAPPKRTVHIALPVASFDRFVDEEPAARMAALDVLSVPDPVITSMAIALVNARAAGAGELHAECAAQYLVAHLLTPRIVRTPEQRALSNRQLDVVTEYMRANLTGRIKLDDLAREVAMSRFHFLRLFSEATGCSPVRFLTGLRIDAARRQLELGDEPVGMVGRRSGFPNASHFAATFHRYVGCSPTEYRRRTHR